MIIDNSERLRLQDIIKFGQNAFEQEKKLIVKLEQQLNKNITVSVNSFI